MLRVKQQGKANREGVREMAVWPARPEASKTAESETPEGPLGCMSVMECQASPGLRTPTAAKTQHKHPQDGTFTHTHTEKKKKRKRKSNHHATPSSFIKR